MNKYSNIWEFWLHLNTNADGKLEFKRNNVSRLDKEIQKIFPNCKSLERTSEKIRCIIVLDDKQTSLMCLFDMRVQSLVTPLYFEWCSMIPTMIPQYFTFDCTTTSICEIVPFTFQRKNTYPMLHSNTCSITFDGFIADFHCWE